MDTARKTIFLVDDDMTNLTIGKKALADYYNVFTLSSGALMLKMLENLQPDLILLDVDMPKRMMAIGDVYDALIETRPYKDAFPHEKVVEIIRESRGSHFDPVLADLFGKIHGEFDRISDEVK